MNRTYSRLIGATFLWATVFHIGKYALTEMSPLLIATWRYSIAAIVMLLLGLPALRKNWAQVQAHWPILLLLSLFGVIGFTLFMFYGLSHTSAVNAALIMAFNPALIMVLSALLNRERINSQQTLGLLLGLCGVFVVVSHGSLDALINLRFSHGDVLIGIASLCWAVYCVLPKRYASQLPSAQLSSTTIILAAAIMFLLACFTEPEISQMPPTKLLLPLLFLGIFGTVIPYFWWNQSVQQIGSAKAGVFMNLVPMFASLIGVALGQQVQLSQLAGAVLVIAGVFITGLKIQFPGKAKVTQLAS